MPEILKRILFGGQGAISPLGDVGLLILRVGFGCIMAFSHGLGKVPPPDGFVGGVASLGFPAPGLFAWAAGLAEFVGGLLLALGLWTRPAATFLLTTMLVAVFIRHGADPFARQELGLLYGLFSLCVMLTGSGRFGLDALARKKFE